jgi:hypothetical protein
LQMNATRSSRSPTRCAMSPSGCRPPSSCSSVPGYCVARAGGAIRVLLPGPLATGIMVPHHSSEMKASARSEAKKGSGAQDSLKISKVVREGAPALSPATYITRELKWRSKVTGHDPHQGLCATRDIKSHELFATPITQHPRCCQVGPCPQVSNNGWSRTAPLPGNQGAACMTPC